MTITATRPQSRPSATRRESRLLGTTVILGRPDDPPLAAARAGAEELGLPHVFVDLTMPGLRLDGDRIVDDAGDVLAHLDDASGFYLRGQGAADPRLAQGLRDWAETAPPHVRVVNRRRGAASNLSKPAQSRVISAAGFRTPVTLVTTDPDAAREFIHSHPRVIVKSASAIRSIVRLVSRHEDLSAVAWCPTQFQAYVPGVEHRAHVVGGSVFARRVISDAVDYRYGPATMSSAELPDDVAERCVRLTRSLGLELAGLDLRRTPEGEWFCFEANTSPVWSAFDPDGRIAEALALHLAGL